MASPVADSYVVGSGEDVYGGMYPGTSPDTLTLIDFQTSYASVKPIVQRKAGSTTGDVPVLFTFTGDEPDNIQARVVRATGGAVIKNWTTLSNLSIEGSTGEGVLENVPQGANYLIQIRDGWQPANSDTIDEGSVSWGVGAIFLFWGQSNMNNTLMGSYTNLVPGAGGQNEFAYYNAGHVEGSIFDDAGWHGPTNGSSGPGGSVGSLTGNIIGFLRIVSAALEDLYGYEVPVGIIPWAFGATGIGAFSPGGVRYIDLFESSGSNYTTKDIGFASPHNVYAGDFEGALGHHGEANQEYTSAAYQSSMQTLYDAYLDYVSQFGRTAETFLFAPAVLGNYGVSACPTIENIRTAVANFETANAGTGVQIGWTTIDLTRTDTLHFGGENEQRRSMHRCIQTVLNFVGAASFSGRGPQLNTTPSRTGLEVTLSVIHDGGTALELLSPGSAPTGFYANTAANFTGTDITPTVELINSSTQIKLTFPGGTTFPVYVKYMGAEIGTADSCNPDFSNAIYDNVSYPSTATGADVEAMGLPLLPTVGAITIN